MSALLVAPALFHWFILPTALCGVLIGVDAVDWATGRISILDPSAALGVYGLYFFFAAPLLNVIVGEWPRALVTPADWRDPLGVLAAVNAVGLGLYRLLIPLRGARTRPTRARRQLDRAFGSWATVAAALSIAAFVAILVALGGPVRFAQLVGSGLPELTGWGWLLIAGEGFPLILLSIVVVTQRGRLKSRPLLMLIIFLVFLIGEFFVAGLRGSRSNTVWPVLIALGMIHVVVGAIPRKWFVIAGTCLAIFMFGYGLFKTTGVSFVESVGSLDDMAALASSTGRTLHLLAFEDLARASVQAVVVDQVQTGHHPLAYGSTYVSALLSLVPGVEGPPDKIQASTDLLYGFGSLAAGYRSSRVLGLVGEAIVNAGLLGGCLAFVPLALAVRYGRHAFYNSYHHPSAAVQLLAPYAALVAIWMLVMDADNVVWLLTKQLGPIAAIVGLAAMTTKPQAPTNRRRPVRVPRIRTNQSARQPTGQWLAPP